MNKQKQKTTVSQHVVCQTTTFFRQQKAPPNAYPCMRKQKQNKRKYLTTEGPSQSLLTLLHRRKRSEIL